MSHTGLCIGPGTLSFFACLIHGSRGLQGMPLSALLWFLLDNGMFFLTYHAKRDSFIVVLFIPAWNCMWSGTWQKHSAKFHTNTPHWLDCSFDWWSCSFPFVILCQPWQCHKDVTLHWQGKMRSDGASHLAKMWSCNFKWLSHGWWGVKWCPDCGGQERQWLNDCKNGFLSGIGSFSMKNLPVLVKC